MPELKKKFFEIDLPIINQKVNLIATSQENLVGKTIKIDLTRRLKGKSSEITFKILPELKIKPARLLVLGYFIRRMMRKSVNYVEDSFSAESKDSTLRIKPFLITRKKVSRVIRSELRKRAKEEIQAELKEKTCEEIFSDLITGKIQKSLSLKLKKIYPLALCEIRDIFLVKEKEPVKTEKI